MKLIKFFMLMIASSAIDHFAMADSTSKATPHSFDRENFCDEGAEKTIKHFNELTKPDAEKIEGLKLKINELEAKKKIINDMQSIRNEYLAAFDAINSESKIAKETSRVKKSSIDQFKKLLNKTLTLNALSLLTKDGALPEVSPQTVKELCAQKGHNTKNNSELLFCKRYGEVGSLRGAFNDSEIAGLNKTIANFSLAIKQIPDQKPVIEQARGIIDSIPSGIKPDGVFEILATNSPVLLNMLLKADSRDELMKCLNGGDAGDAICDKLLNDKEQRVNVEAVVGQEIIKTENKLSDNYTNVKKQINDLNSKDLSALLRTFDNPLEGRDEENKKLLNEKIVKLKSIGDVKNGFMSIGLGDQDYTDLTTRCEIKSETKGDDLKKQIKSCQEKVEAILAKAETAKNNLSGEETQLRKELGDLLNNPSLERIEKMKQFTIQRYIRECPKAQDNQLTSNIMQIKCDNISSGSGQVESLVSDYTQILGRLQEGNTVSDKKGELATFSKDELSVYSNFCQNMSKTDDEYINASCNKVNQYSSDIGDKRELKDWKEFNKKYYVQYDKSSPNGYTAYEKESNTRIFAVGVAQGIANQIVPYWFMNFQMSNQIDFMTSQAIMQKQMNYMYTPNSPWMNASYFQGSYFPSTGFNFAY